MLNKKNPSQYKTAGDLISLFHTHFVEEVRAECDKRQPCNRDKDTGFRQSRYNLRMALIIKVK